MDLLNMYKSAENAKHFNIAMKFYQLILNPATTLTKFKAHTHTTRILSDIEPQFHQQE